MNYFTLVCDDEHWQSAMRLNILSCNFCEVLTESITLLNWQFL